MEVIGIYNKNAFSDINKHIAEFYTKPLKTEIITYKDYKSEKIENIYLKNNIKNIISSLRLVSLDERISKKKFNELSSSEKIKIIISISLSKKSESYIFNGILDELYNTEKKWAISLINMLSKKYNKRIIIITQDKSILNLLCKKIIVIDDSINTYKNINESNIENDMTEFIKLCKNNGLDYFEYTDVDEILKAIYRDIGGKK